MWGLLREGAHGCARWACAEGVVKGGLARDSGMRIVWVDVGGDGGEGGLIGLLRWL